MKSKPVKQPNPDLEDDSVELEAGGPGIAAAKKTAIKWPLPSGIKRPRFIDHAFESALCRFCRAAHIGQPWPGLLR